MSEEELKDKLAGLLPELKEKVINMDKSSLLALLQQAIGEAPRPSEEKASPPPQPIEINEGEDIDVVDKPVEEPAPPVQSTSKPDTPVTDGALPSMAEMTRQLVAMMPEIEGDLKAVTDEKTLRDIYLQAFSKDKSKPNLEPTIVVPLGDDASLQDCLKRCIEAYPELEEQLRKMTPAELKEKYKKLYEELSKPKAPQPSTPVQRAMTAPEPFSSKRSHSQMVETNVSSKMNGDELKKILSKKLPGMRKVIMTMSNEELMKIYEEVIKGGSKRAREDSGSSRKSSKSNKEGKPVIVVDRRRNGSDSMRQSDVSEQEFEHVEVAKTQVREIKHSDRKRMIRTYVLMHQEEVDMEELAKGSKSDKGLQNEDVGALLRKLADVMKRK